MWLEPNARRWYCTLVLHGETTEQSAVYIIGQLIGLIILGCLATQLLYTTFLSASIMPGPDQAWLLFHRPHKTFIKLRDFSPRLVGPRGSHQPVHTRCSFQNQPQLCRNKRQ